jgi:predicted peptidase
MIRPACAFGIVAQAIKHRAKNLRHETRLKTNLFHRLTWAMLLVLAAAIIIGCAGVTIRLRTSPTIPATASTIATATATSTAIPPTSTPIPTVTAVAMPTIVPTVAPTAAISAVRVGQYPYSTTVQVVSARGVTRSVEVSYLLYLPQDYGQAPSRQWPLMLFLHGSDENGTNPELVATTGLPELLKDREDFPFVVVSPQSPPDQVWDSQLDVLIALLDQIQRQYSIDAKRVYLTGLSMGGFGAWDLALNYPQRFAAVVPIAGGWIFQSDAVPKSICNLKDVPIWVFHGARDDIVLPRQSESMVDALRACGGNVQFTLYPDANHKASWTNAYADPMLYEWMLNQVRP